MKKIGISLLGILMLILAFFSYVTFFFPDEQLDDFSDLKPNIQKVLDSDNSYFVIEDIENKIEEEGLNMVLIKDFLENGENEESVRSIVPKIEKYFEVLGKASEMSIYKDPKEDQYEILSYFDGHRRTGNINVLTIMRMKAWLEIENNQIENGIETHLKNAELASKMRRGSISIIDYVVNHESIKKSVDDLNNLAKSGLYLTDDQKIRVGSLSDKNCLELINAIKFDFYMTKNLVINDLASGLEMDYPWLINKYNFQYNATLNHIAKNFRALIKAIENNKVDDFIDNMRSDTDLFKAATSKNGIGRAYADGSTPDINIMLKYCTENAYRGAQSQKNLKVKR